MTDLFQPLRAGELWLLNRIVMAPLTRIRCGSDRVPDALNAEYYAQRASAGLILSEAVIVHPSGASYPGAPGLWNAGQVAGWRKVTDAVHASGGRILAQLWHVGRISHPDFLEGARPVAPSAVAAPGMVSHLHPRQPHPVPRALEREELPAIVEAFHNAAGNAQRAGFDGVEIHAGNGYLLDQFLQDGSNRRLDDYGGSTANRARLLLEVTESVVRVWGAGRVGVHLAPRGDAHGMGDSDYRALFTHVATELGRHKLAFLCLREARRPDSLAAGLRQCFGGPLILNEGLGLDSARQALQSGECDAVAFGRLFIANPDLPARFAAGASLNRWNSETFYGIGLADRRAGYTDYPTMK